MAVELLTLEEIGKLPKGVNGGYIIRYLPKGHPQRRYKSAGWQFEHRLVVEAILGRCLRKTEEIHHRTDRLDNGPFNLKLMKNAPHARLHNPLLGEFRLCLNCGKPFYRRLNRIKKGIGLYCSPKCAAQSPARIASAEKHLTGRTPNMSLNRYIVEQKDVGRTWPSLARELEMGIWAIRSRYRWLKERMEVA
ncbi:hypothetical protein ES708_27503 [subsurface metagenome]